MTTIKGFCDSLSAYSRLRTIEVKIGEVVVGGDNPLRLQSMTNTDTNDTPLSVAQIERIAAAGGDIVRLTAQGPKQAHNLADIHSALRSDGCMVPLVADIHFTPEAALVAAQSVEKVRINPGNFNDKGGQLDQLIQICKQRGVALRIGVNHGSLSPAMMERYGDTPEGMVASAMEFLKLCEDADFDQIVVSMKSSNVRVMVQAYRMLVEQMRIKDMHYPLHLGVTEAGNDDEGRIKSAVGIGALLADGIGDTIRVSLTEAPENEIAVARALADYFVGREKHTPIPTVNESLFSPYIFRKRISTEVCGVGAERAPVLYSELSAEQLAQAIEVDITTLDHITPDKIVILTTSNINGVAEQRACFLLLAERGATNPVIIKRSYSEPSIDHLRIKAAADIGPLFVDGFGDGIWIENSGAAATTEQIDTISLAILQAARVRISKPEYIACPGCGRTLYNLEKTLKEIKAKTAHMIGVKIGVMGCIVNGPGEMADADYGYVGAGAGRITLYKGRDVVKRNIAEADAIDELISLIESSEGNRS